jgi:hypothetical protein
MPGMLAALVIACISRSGARTRSPSRLAVDSRGAILVLGILLGAMLVSVLFHVASVGQAILWRENAQDAADAVAYEAALWNARGMNVIVALNLFLTLLLAILMFWRLALVVVTTMLVVSALACAASLIPGLEFLEPLCDLTPRLAKIVKDMIEKDRRYSPRLYQAMKLIHRGQVIVASATPVISAVSSSLTVMTDDNYDVEVALGVGVQQVPSALYPKSIEDGEEPEHEHLPCGVKPDEKPTADLSGHIMGKPVSLPMEHWFELDELCGKAATMQTMIIDLMLNRLAGTLGFPELGQVVSGGPFANIWSFVAEILSPVLCESLDGSVGERFEEIIDRACKNDANRDACEKKMRDDAAKNNDSAGANGADKPKVGGVKSDDVLYAKPYWLASNGNLFMQSWGVVLAKRRFLEGADRLIQFSNRFGGDAQFKQVEDEAWVVAGAEMFFDCGQDAAQDQQDAAAGKVSGGAWETCQYAASWAINWRARLRRFHDPGEYAAGVAQTAIVDGIWSGAEKLLGSGPVGNLINKITLGGKLNGTGAGKFGGSHIHGFVLSLARQELTDRVRSSLYEHAGIRSAASRAFEELGAGRDEIIH